MFEDDTNLRVHREVSDSRFHAHAFMPISKYATIASAWLCVYWIEVETSECVEYYEDAVRYGIVFG